MKKCVRTLLTLLMCLLMAVNVYADEAGSSHKPDLITDYYMIVESPDGGVDIYSDASFDATKLNNEQIPNGTALHIEGEKEDQNKRVWGYVQYHGMYGYVPEDDLKPATRSEAIDSELYLAGSGNVDYNADYDVEPRTNGGSVYLYQGPGEKYGKVPGTDEIAKGTKLHVYEDANLADGSHWAQVQTENGTDGWVNMDLMKPYGTADPDNSIVNMEVATPTADQETNAGAANGEANAAESGTETGDTEEAQNGELLAKGETDLTPTPSATATPTPEPTKEATPTPEPTPTVEPTKEPTPTAEPTPEPTPTVEPTKEATPTAEPTEEPTPTVEPTKESTPTEEPEETAAPTEKAENADTKEASASQVTGVSSLVKNPFVWIVIVAIIAVIILLIYHFKKRDKE